MSTVTAQWGSVTGSAPLSSPSFTDNVGIGIAASSVAQLDQFVSQSVSGLIPMHRMQALDPVSGRIAYATLNINGGGSRGGNIVFGESGGGFPDSSIRFALSTIRISQGGNYTIALNTNSIDRLTVNGDGSVTLAVSLSTPILRLPNSGTAATAGNATLAAGTVTITTSAASASSLIYINRKTSGGTIGEVTYTTTTGSFTITSASVLDTSTVTWSLINPY